MIIESLVCIPVYNNPSTILDVVRRTLDSTQLPVLVLDDGSTTQVKDLLKDLVGEPRLTIHRFSENKGKGEALRWAFEFAIKNGYTHLISIDGDGQHFPEDIIKVQKKIQENPWALVIGAREFASDVPEISKFGRKFSNYWVKYQTEMNISDSQSGFRAYPMFFAQTLNFSRSKYDFEIEVLIKMLWKGVQLVEVPVQVYYPPGNSRVSHFNKWNDNVRISLLNAALVIMTMFKSRRSPSQISAALGVGVLIGCTPLFGLHTLIALAASFVFRLNAVLTWVGTQISIPPLAPLLFVASLKIGSLITGSNLALDEIQSFSVENLGDRFTDYFVGSLVLGLSLGLITAGISYLFFKIKSGLGAPNWTGKMRGGRFGNWLIGFILKKIGLRAGYFCLNFMIPYFYFFAPKARKSSIEYWKVVEPSLSYWALRKRAYLHIYHFASVLMDRVYQSFFTETKFAMESDGFQNITTAFEKKSGLVIVGAHLGAWDIALRYLKDHGFEGDFFSVQFESQKAHFNQVKSANEGKQVSRIKSESSDDFVLQIHKAVRGGLPVALMGDRPPPTSCELVRFFGKLIPLDTTPFRIAAAARVPLVFSFGIKSRPGVYSFSCTKARVLNYEDEIPRSILLKKWVQEYADVLESLLKKNPASWFNFYPVFSSIPDFGPLERPGEAPKRQIRIELREELQSSKTLEVRSLSASSNQGVDSRPT